MQAFETKKATVLGKRIKETPCSMQQKRKTPLRKTIRMQVEVLAVVSTKPTSSGM